MRRALVVRGGWEGHEPRACTDSFLPFLAEHGFQVEISETLDVFTDADLLAATDLVVHCWSMGQITSEQVRGLAAAVRGGTGLAGWHGGIVAAFHDETWQHLTGGVFVYHPPEFVAYDLITVPGRRSHPIVEGIGTVRLHSEKYWVLTDALCDVLASVTFAPDEPGGDPVGDTPWRREVTVPAVWTRQWGTGRVFVSTVGHRLADLEVPQMRLLTQRGLLWAARRWTQDENVVNL